MVDTVYNIVRIETYCVYKLVNYGDTEIPSHLEILTPYKSTLTFFFLSFFLTQLSWPIYTIP